MGTKKRVMIILAVVALVAVLGVCLVACNSGDYASRLSKKGYRVSVTKNEEAAEIKSVYEIEVDEGDIEWMVYGTRVLEGRRDYDEQEVYIYKFTSKKTAQNVLDELNDLLDEAADFDDEFDIKAELKGKILFVGTSDAIKDAK